MLINKQNDVVYNFVHLRSETLTVVHSLIGECLDYTYEELCSVFTLLDGTELWVEE